MTKYYRLSQYNKYNQRAILHRGQISQKKKMNEYQSYYRIKFIAPS